MIYIILMISSILFVELFLAFSITSEAKKVIQLTSNALETVKSKSLTDREKEVFMRKNSLVMLLTTLMFIVKFFSIFIIIYIFINGFLFFYPDLTDLIMMNLTSLKPLLLLSLATLIYVWARNVISSKL